MPRSPFLIAALACIATTGCTSKLLTDFEHDAVGAAPRTPSDAPPGASVFAIGPTVTGTGPIAGRRSLRAQGPVDQQRNLLSDAWFTGAQLSGAGRPLTYFWSGRLEGAARAEIRLYFGHYQPALRLQIEPAGLFIEGSGARVRVAGTPPGTRHSAIVTIDPPTGTYRVTAAGAPTITGTVVERSLLVSPQYTGINLSLLSARSPADAYLMDDVNILEADPR